MVLLFVRANQELFRSPTLILLHYIVPCIVGIAFGFVYRGITPDLSGIQNYAGSFFTIQVFWCLVSITAVDTWNASRVAVHRELTSRSYTVFPYFIAYALNDLLIMRIMPPVCFAVPFSYLSGVADDVESFTYFAEVLILTSVSFASICLFLGALFPSSRTGTSAGVVVVVLSLIFGGLLVNRASAYLEQKWYNPIFYMTPLSYAYEAMMVLVLDGSTITFNPKGIHEDVQTTGSIWLANFGMSAKNYEFDMKGLLGFTFGFFVLTGITLQLSYWLSTCTCSFACRSSSGSSGSSGRSSSEGSSDEGSSEEASIHNVENVQDISVCLNEHSEHEEHKENVTNTPSSNNSNMHHSLAFGKINCRIGTRQVLRDVGAVASTASGGVFGILGPSGAGKTTLLDIIAGRKNTGTYSGNVTVDGIGFSSKAQRVSVFGYVMQDESLLDVLSVRESLEFAASLRLKGGAATALEIQTMVNSVLDDLGLRKCEHNWIGSVESFRGISGGERKRVSIGMELCAQPPVLLLDEPTTGLDAAGAARIMSLLQHLVQTKKTIVICTIHTPRSDIFHSLGHVLILNALTDTNRKKKTTTKLHSVHLLQDGESSSSSSSSSSSNVVYSGSPAKLSFYFENQGHLCPLGMNIADYVLDIISTKDYIIPQGEGWVAPRERLVSWDDDNNDTNNDIREDQQVILVAVDIDDELFTNPGEWFHLPTNQTDRSNVHNHHMRNRRSSFSRVRTAQDDGTDTSRRLSEEEEYPCLASTFLYVIASDKENATEIERISKQKWRTIRKAILERSCSTTVVSESTKGSSVSSNSFSSPGVLDTFAATSNMSLSRDSVLSGMSSTKLTRPSLAVVGKKSCFDFDRLYFDGSF